MDPRSAYRLQVMEKLGAPLLAALPHGMDGEKAAEAVAALVAKSVQAGLALSSAMKLTDQDGDIDSIRLSLAAIAAPLLAQAYKDSGKMPDEGTIEKLVKGLEAALVFSESFTPAIEHTARLKSLHNPLPVIDTTQTTLLSLNALSPAVISLQQFSFGQSEPALIKEVAERLQALAAGLSEASIPGGEAGDKSFGQLMVLRALSELFAAAHKNTVQAHKGEFAPALDAVWTAFDAQAAMMFALAGAAIPGARADENVAPSAPAQAQQKTPAAPAGGPMGFFKKGDDAPAAPAAPTPSATPPAGSPPAVAGGSPMSFFKPGAKKSDESTGE